MNLHPFVPMSRIGTTNENGCIKSHDNLQNRGARYIMYSLVPRPNPHAGKRVWCTSGDFLGFQDANSHVILIIVMQQHCGLIGAAGALSHEKSHAVNLIGARQKSELPRHQAQEIARSTPDPLPRVGVGSGTETILCRGKVCAQRTAGTQTLVYTKNLQRLSVVAIFVIPS